MYEKRKFVIVCIFKTIKIFLKSYKIQNNIYEN